MSPTTLVTRGTPSSRARVGCDVQAVAAVEAAVRSFGQRYLDRVYTAAEQAACRRGGPTEATSRLSAESLSARFAAKEAVLKLLGSADGVDLREVEVIGTGGRPGLRLHGSAARLAERRGAGEIDISLSHDGGMAFAVAACVEATGTHHGGEAR
ncbi:holo-ACP synthase [soil metagenome]